MRRNKLRILSCCLFAALMGVIGGGVFVAIVAWVLPKIISGMMHKMRDRIQDQN
jgi:hypothetical protein